MSGLFEALEKLQNNNSVKKHTVKIGDHEVEVDLNMKLQIIKNGEDKYMLEHGKVVLRPIVRKDRRFPELRNDAEGYHFYDNDPYWVEYIGEEGFTWQIESE
jgi:hypothetical protein